MPIAESWADPEMMVSICSAAVGWDYLRRVSRVLQALLPQPVTWEAARPVMVSVAAVVPLHGGHKDLGLGGYKNILKLGCDSINFKNNY